jgi:hypothetical protein
MVSFLPKAVLRSFSPGKSVEINPAGEFYQHLVAAFSPILLCPKKLNLNFSTEKLFVSLLYKKSKARKMLVKLTPDNDSLSRSVTSLNCNH